MVSIVEALRTDTNLIQKIQRKLPHLFQIAELESSRAGRIRMEVGFLRERILVALFIYKFGEINVDTEIPITEPEVDVRVHGVPISIKTLTSSHFVGVKLVWTVDAENAKQFQTQYHPACDMLFVQIIWGHRGELFYIPHHAQEEVFNRVGRERYIKLPPLGKNPRGAEITSEALEALVRHKETLAIDINWRKELIQFNAYERWVQYWQNE